MASSAARITFRILIIALVLLVLFYVGRPLYWKISATIHEIRENKQTVQQGLSKIARSSEIGGLVPRRRIRVPRRSGREECRVGHDPEAIAPPGFMKVLLSFRFLLSAFLCGNVNGDQMGLLFRSGLFE
ncbi:uncharacterized protein Pyn_22398 [Prunus yedoensis var. nudiflora]|uniref:Uncharacterized protein n=1 Tax=Prunus yedoensis var. nudiflora TaxID=2094558 RepID=A0A314UUJ7_PRUYE|nr:uncharacterized protein Pyn_22398 [Prunus yedoensis var. nudiflora]